MSTQAEHKNSSYYRMIGTIHAKYVGDIQSGFLKTLQLSSDLGENAGLIEIIDREHISDDILMDSYKYYIKIAEAINSENLQGDALFLMLCDARLYKQNMYRQAKSLLDIFTEYPKGFIKVIKDTLIRNRRIEGTLKDFKQFGVYVPTGNDFTYGNTYYKCNEDLCTRDHRVKFIVDNGSMTTKYKNSDTVVRKVYVDNEFVGLADELMVKNSVLNCVITNHSKQRSLQITCIKGKRSNLSITYGEAVNAYVTYYSNGGLILN